MDQLTPEAVDDRFIAAGYRTKLQVKMVGIDDDGNVHINLSIPLPPGCENWPDDKHPRNNLFAEELLMREVRSLDQHPLEA